MRSRPGKEGGDESGRVMGHAALVIRRDVPSHKIFVRMASAWVLCPGGRTVTRIYQIAEPFGERAHDAYHRFFREGAWSMSSLWRLLALALIGTFYRSGRIPLYLDDTVFHKTGRKIEGA